MALAFTTQSSTRGSKVWNKDINRETKMAPRRAKIVEAKVAPLWRDREQDGRTFLRRSTGACWSFWAHTRRRGAFSSTLFRSAKNNTICRVVRRRNSFRILRHTNFFSFLTASPLKISWWNGDSSASDQVLATSLRTLITFVSIRDIFKSDKRIIFTWSKEYWIEIVSFFIILFHLIMHCTKLLVNL